MSTNAAFVSDVRSALKWQSADVSITDRAILRDGRAIRNTYVKQHTDRRKLWESPNLFTPLRVELEEVPLANYCEYQSDCHVARSKKRLPKILDSGNFGLIHQGVFTLSRKKSFIEVSPARYSNILNLGLPGKNTYYWIFDGYLVVTDPTLESVLFPAFLVEEADVSFSLDCEEADDCPSNPMKNDFHCPEFMWADVVKATASLYIQTFKRAVEDVNSNDLDESK